MKYTILCLIYIWLNPSLQAQQLAFPGAEGYGKFSQGGRGGAVYTVTNLHDRGKGSLRAAIEAQGPRTIVFRVSGTIILESPLIINNPYITIAGQTAPGDGICLRKYPLIIEADHVIIRHVRVRLGDESGEDADAISARLCKHLMIDHVSASWGVDEVMSVYHCDSITVQWCIISESLYKSNHVKGDHGYGGIWGSNYGTYHHNLLAHHSSRNPRFASGSGFTDYRNNVIYNWGFNSCYGGEKSQRDDPRFGPSTINMVGNYYKPGPATEPGPVSRRIASPSSRRGAADFGKWYIAKNQMVGNKDVTLDNWNGGVQHQPDKIDATVLKLNIAWPAMPIEEQSATEAYEAVMKYAGTSVPTRDAIDIRIIHETRSGTARFEGPTYKQERTVSDPSQPCGMIDSQNDAEGWPALTSLPARTDTDRDGMPDAWEEVNGLDPTNPEDCNRVAANGYTMLEQFLNGE